VAMEAGFRSIYLGGSPDAQTLTTLVAGLAREGEVLLGLPHGDGRFGLFAPMPDYLGKVLEFTNRPPGEGLEPWLGRPPADCRIRRVDRDLFGRCLERDLLSGIYGGPEQALARSFGFCLLRGEQILSEAHAGPAAQGLIEIGTMTGERYRYHGYATLVCAHLIRACEERGWRTYWNCNSQNRASVALARRLGYRTVAEYELRGWFPEGA